MNGTHDKHRERLREKIKANGIDSLSDHEQLEYCLFHVIPVKNTNDLAHDLINKFGTFAGVCEASTDDLMQVKGVGIKVASYLRSMPEITRIYMMSRWKKRENFDSKTKLLEYAVSMAAGRIYETYMIIILDNSMNLIYSGVISQGTQTETAAYPSLVMEQVIRHKAQNVVLVHNHPGGTLKPSASDREITDTISELLKTLDITLVDHIIVSGYETYSMRKAKQLKYM